MSAKDEVFWLIQRYGYARRNGQYQGKKSAEWMGEISKAIDAAVAEARAPLVEALGDCHALLQDAHYEYDLLGRNFCGPDVAKVIEAAAAALAKETP